MEGQKAKIRYLKIIYYKWKITNFRYILISVQILEKDSKVSVSKWVEWEKKFHNQWLQQSFSGAKVGCSWPSFAIMFKTGF